MSETTYYVWAQHTSRAGTVVGDRNEVEERGLDPDSPDFWTWTVEEARGALRNHDGKIDSNSVFFRDCVRSVIDYSGERGDEVGADLIRIAVEDVGACRQDCVLAVADLERMYPGDRWVAQTYSRRIRGTDFPVEVIQREKGGNVFDRVCDGIVEGTMEYQTEAHFLVVCLDANLGLLRR